MKGISLFLLFSGLVIHNQGLIQEEEAEDVERKDDYQQESSGEKRIFNPFPYSYENSKQRSDQLRTKLQRIRGYAAGRARRSHQKLIKDWNQKQTKERRDRTLALVAVSDNINAMIAVDQDSTAGIIAVLNVMKALKPMESANGHIVSIPAMFVSSCVNVFGEILFPFPLQSIIKKEILNSINSRVGNYQKDIFNVSNIETTAQTYLRFKKFLNKLGKDDDKINVSKTTGVQSTIYREYENEFPVINHLRSQMQLLIRNNRPTDAKKFLTYLELYAKLETIRQMMLTHMISLIPESRPSTIIYILTTLRNLKRSSLPFVNVIHNHTLGSKFIAYYDGQVYKIISSYMDIQLGLPKHRDYLPGLSCILKPRRTKLRRNPYTTPFGWFEFSGMNYPYFGAEDALVYIKGSCKWRIVHHGQNLYSIVNKYGCPNGPSCDAFLSFDDVGNQAPVTVKQDDPVLWGIRYTSRFRTPTSSFWTYDVRVKRFCGNKCDCSLGYGPRTIRNARGWNQYVRKVGRIDCTRAQIFRYSSFGWIIYKASPPSDMITESGSAAKNQSSENQEDNVVSVDVAEDVSSEEVTR